MAGSFPSKLVASHNILELGFNITSAISHPTIMLMNSGRIGHENEDFYFYKEGISIENANIIRVLDEDRQRIGQLYGLTLPSYLELMNRFYDFKCDSYYEFFTRSPVHNKLKLCPPSVDYRYLSQDVPFIILPWYNLGLRAGYDSKVMRSIIELSSLLNGADYSACGRRLADHIFSDMSLDEVSDFVTYGAVSAMKPSKLDKAS
ncbi:NAD/NADP octopine/nopaline dehydrogenase family protein [Dongshaea marina]|uniref:NAD/NADP octopine/nopaline dehydrogenase family protein n=1 Tax=Dongshaea marina TaxID=2047966 RepID=UPI00131F1B79|nr:NAD/NADP octopine/nopaline dehydrogenase family protein [Dongshaea marina]